MLGRGLRGILEAKGADHFFREASGLLRGADVVFGNLEAPLTEASDPNLQIKPADEPFLRADPRSAGALSRAGFNAMSLANTHINDFGGEGIESTRAALHSCGISYTGAGLGHRQAREPATWTRGDQRLGLLAYTDHGVLPSREWGVAPLRLPLMVRDVRALRAKGFRVVVSIHTGVDFCDYPFPFTIRLARSLVDAGADLVLGHHPHVLQGWERYRGGVILYSLGNFVFDEADVDLVSADFSRSSYVKRMGLTYEPGDTRPVDSVVFRCRLTENGIEQIEFLPVRINLEGQPVPLQGPAARQVLSRLEDISSHFQDPEFGEWERLEDLFLDVSVGELIERPGAVLRRLHRVRPRHLQHLSQWLARRMGR
jgi:poly-gamma-glutamate synthesis protein (capsule biosynthesis protein)